MRSHAAFRTFLFVFGLLVLRSASAQTYTEDSYNPNVVSWGPNRLDFFVMGHDGHLWHQSFNEVVWQSAWDDRGGPEPGKLPGALSVVSWGLNRIDVFMGGGDYQHVWHTAWNGWNWQPWDDRGTTASPLHTVYSLSAVSWGSNRLDVFAIADGGHVWQLTWNGSTWIPWTDLGAPAGLTLNTTTAVSWGWNRIDVFARSGWSGSATVWHRAWNGSTWGAWESRGVPPTGAVGPLVPVSWGPGRIDLFSHSRAARNPDHCWHDSWNGSSWQTAWDDRGAPPGTQGLYEGTLAATSWGPNRLDVFGVSDSGHVWHNSWNGSAWQTAWDDRDKPWAEAGVVWATSSGDQRLDVFVQSWGEIWVLRWNGSTWLPWRSLGFPPGGTI